MHALLLVTRFTSRQLNLSRHLVRTHRSLLPTTRLHHLTLTFLLQTTPHLPRPTSPHQRPTLDITLLLRPLRDQFTLPHRLHHQFN